MGPRGYRKVEYTEGSGSQSDCEPGRRFKRGLGDYLSAHCELRSLARRIYLPFRSKVYGF